MLEIIDEVCLRLFGFRSSLFDLEMKRPVYRAEIVNLCSDEGSKSVDRKSRHVKKISMQFFPPSFTVDE